MSDEEVGSKPLEELNQDPELQEPNDDPIETDASEKEADSDNEGKEKECHAETEAPESPLARARKEFAKNRKIIIKNIPPVSYEEVKEFMGSYGVSDIAVSKKARHAIVTLTEGSQADDLINELNGKKILDTEVSVEIHPHENLLCVAALPLNLEEEEFRCFMEEYGPIERCFLMRTDAGKSKGYGFVEFAHNREKTAEVKGWVDGKKMGSCVLQCDFLDESHVTFESLHSLCLHVDHLPPCVNSVEELMKILCQVVPPTFCQLAIKNGRSLGFAVVEYESSEIAEMTQKLTNSFVIETQCIRVIYCIPGQKGKDIFVKLMSKNESEASSKGMGLLPNPTGYNNSRNQLPSLLNLPLGGDVPTPNPMMQTLLAENPELLNNFKDILLKLQQQLPPNKVGLMGNPLMNPNLQVSLLSVLLARQVQSHPDATQNTSLQQALGLHGMESFNTQSKPSLLGNPLIAQANSMIQNLFEKKNESDKKETEEASMKQEDLDITDEKCAVTENEEDKSLTDASEIGAQDETNLNLPETNAEGAKSEALKGEGEHIEPKGSLLGEPPQTTSGVAAPRPTSLLGDPPQTTSVGTSQKPASLLGDPPQTTNVGTSQKPASLLGDPPKLGLGLLGDAPGVNMSQQMSDLQGTMSSEGDTKDKDKKPVNLLNMPTATPPVNGIEGLLGILTKGMAMQSQSAAQTTTPATPILALMIETQIRQTLNNLQRGIQRPGFNLPNPKPGMFHPGGARGGLLPTPPGPSKPPSLLGDKPYSKRDHRVKPLMSQSWNKQEYGAGRYQDKVYSEKKSSDNQPKDDYSGWASEKDDRRPRRQNNNSQYGNYNNEHWDDQSYNDYYSQGQYGAGDYQDSHNNYNSQQWNQGKGQSSNQSWGNLTWGNQTGKTPDSQTGGKSKNADNNKDNQFGNGQEMTPEMQQWAQYAQYYSQCNQYNYEYYNQMYQQMYAQQYAYMYGNNSQNESGNQKPSGASSGNQGWDKNAIEAYQKQYQDYYKQYYSAMGYQTQDSTTTQSSNTTRQNQGATQPPPPGNPPPPPIAPPAKRPAPSSSDYFSLGHQASLATPRAKPPHLLPSPEPSPEVSYVGQHSQGIGGHYAETVSAKRLKLDPEDY